MSVANRTNIQFKSIDNLKYKLSNDVFGQDEAISKVVDKVLIHYTGLGDENKPIGSFIFTGPTGVGKTELAKSLAKHLNMHLIRFDMSEYTSENSINTFIGGSAGLVGYENGGLLTNAVLENPKCVLLFDEIEKANQKVLNIFLQMLDYATLTSTKGKKVSFKQAIIIFTSNIGAVSIEKRTVGFGSSTYLEKESTLKEHLSPELRARINSHIDFNPINEEMSKLIVTKYLNEIVSKLSKMDIYLSFSKKVVEHITQLSKDGLGARNIHNIIETNIKLMISQKLISSEIVQFNKVFIDISDEQFVIIQEKIPKSNDYHFLTAQEAYTFAKVNIGAVVTRSPSGVGFIIKDSIIK